MSVNRNRCKLQLAWYVHLKPQGGNSSFVFILHYNMYVYMLWQAWADAFRSSPDLTGVVHIYEELKRKGIEFPMADLDALSPIHTPQRVRLKKHTDSTNTYVHSHSNSHSVGGILSSRVHQR